MLVLDDQVCESGYGRCVGIIIPDEDRLKELMDAGQGLESRCGFDPSSPVGPRFALVSVCSSFNVILPLEISAHRSPLTCVYQVLNSDKTGKELQDYLGCSGRETDPVTGFSFQV